MAAASPPRYYRLSGDPILRSLWKLGRLCAAQLFHFGFQLRRSRLCCRVLRCRGELAHCRRLQCLKLLASGYRFRLGLVKLRRKCIDLGCWRRYRWRGVGLSKRMIRCRRGGRSLDRSGCGGGGRLIDRVEHGFANEDQDDERDEAHERFHAREPTPVRVESPRSARSPGGGKRRNPPQKGAGGRVPQVGVLADLCFSADPRARVSGTVTCDTPQIPVGYWPGRTGVRARAFKAGLCTPNWSIGKLTKPSANAGDPAFTR